MLPKNVLLTTFFFFLLTPLFAVTFGVNTLADTPDMSPGDGLCQDALGNCSLRAAIQEANALAGPDQINIPVGNYLLTMLGAGEDACATGDLDILTDITIVGANAWSTFIDGNRLDRVFHVLAAGRLNISQVYVSNGLVSSGFGAGLLNEGNLTIDYCTIDTNACILSQGATVAGGFGGGVANLGVLMVSNTTFQRNVAQGGIGNDAKNGGGGGGSSPGFGGAIYNESTGTVTMTNCTLAGNRALGGNASRGATNGGVFSAAGSAGTGPSPGAGGTSGGGAGGNGGIYSGGGGGGSSCSVAGAGGNGGYGAGGGGRGARSCGGGSGTVGNPGFGGGSGNGSCCSSCGGGGAGAGFGGGIFNNGGSITITSSTIAFNEALGGFGGGQGGYAARGLAGTGIGGGLFNRSGTIDINNSIISNNLADTLNSLNVSNGMDQGDLFGTFASANGHNFIMTPGAAVLGGNTTNNILNLDPALIALANNGGFNNTFALDPCVPSMAIDVGLAMVALDQRNLAQVGAADIGAFEQQGPCVLLSATALEFRGRNQQNRHVLEWDTEKEINSDKFELYRSLDGINWEFFETRNGAGNSNQAHHYSVIDAAPFPTISYYRLKWILTDGTHSFTNVIALERTDGLDDVNKLYLHKVYPSPATDILSLDIEAGENSSVTIKLFNAIGQLLLNKDFAISAKHQILELDVKDLAAGVYTLVLESEDKTKAQVEKIIKK